MKIKNILFLMAVIFAFVACNDDTDPVLPQYKASVLTHPANDTLYVLEQVNASKVLLTLDWTAYKQTDLLVGAVSYVVQMDLAGNDFSQARTFTPVPGVTVDAESSDYTTSLKVEDVNKVLMNGFRVPADTIANVEFRVITRVGNVVVPSSASNVFKARVIPYKALDTPVLYIIGDGLVGWDNSAAAIGRDLQVFFGESNVDVSVGKYTYTGYFKKGGGLKLVTNAGDWDSAYGYADAAGTLVAKGGGNIPTPAADGFYTFTVDLKALSYNFEPYAAGASAPTYNRIGVVGSATSNGWDSPDAEMTQVTPHVWVIKGISLTAAEMKFRANDAWDVSWGGNSTNLPFGISDSGDNIAIAKGSTYFISFNDLTKNYVIIDEDRLP
ncbi:SusF/SusE family outer membrane protein [Dysgonomonas sp. GY617]|uniref:SusF/SusE family outer membrane protein n=1 Tax=Dysgonomonas sp. GY617 TaxID=2780420 RepID=UPI00188489DC|nr:SusE domain-containing protein [Dysgonomonas sp. GY617]MBF0577280.1 SusF/SusE family outer membrane protein [Dysgonomonas sp. GY617]